MDDNHEVIRVSTLITYLTAYKEVFGDIPVAIALSDGSLLEVMSTGILNIKRQLTGETKDVIFISDTPMNTGDQRTIEIKQK